jgi:hypothetical protein
LSLNFALELKNICKNPSSQAEFEEREKEEEQGC